MDRKLVVRRPNGNDLRDYVERWKNRPALLWSGVAFDDPSIQISLPFGRRSAFFL